MPRPWITLRGRSYGIRMQSFLPWVGGKLLSLYLSCGQLQLEGQASAAAKQTNVGAVAEDPIGPRRLQHRTGNRGGEGNHLGSCGLAGANPGRYVLQHNAVGCGKP